MEPCKATVGDTVRLKAEFRNFEGELVEVMFPELNIYDASRKKLDSFEPTEEKEGKYYHDYTIPNIPGPIYFEFKGELDGKPIVGRSVIDKEWV